MANPTVLVESLPTPAQEKDRERGSDFSELSRRIAGAGLLRRRPLYYTVRFGAVALALAGGVAAFVALGDSWSQLFVAVALAVVFGQLDWPPTTSPTGRSSRAGAPARRAVC